MIWVIITVDEGGVLGVTQQLSQFGNADFVHGPFPQHVQNPFASPHKSDSNNFPNPLVSPNSSIMAQHGSPYTSQLSPTPSETATTPLTARSLFQVSFEIFNACIIVHVFDNLQINSIILNCWRHSLRAISQRTNH